MSIEAQLREPFTEIDQATVTRHEDSSELFNFEVEKEAVNALTHLHRELENSGNAQDTLNSTQAELKNKLQAFLKILEPIEESSKEMKVAEAKRMSVKGSISLLMAYFDLAEIQGTDAVLPQMQKTIGDIVKHLTGIEIFDDKEEREARLSETFEKRLYGEPDARIKARTKIFEELEKAGVEIPVHLRRFFSSFEEPEKVIQAIEDEVSHLDQKKDSQVIAVLNHIVQVIIDCFKGVKELATPQLIPATA